VRDGARVKITVFGLTISSSWGNGHATPYRAIVRALHRRGARVVFFEKNVPYYAAHRDCSTPEYCDLRLYSDWDAVRGEALQHASESDIVINASYCPEGARISDEVLALDGPLHVFYDLDTPITLKSLEGQGTEYLRRDQIARFDLYLSFTGGRVLTNLERDYGARLARPLYGCVDPNAYGRVAAQEQFRSSLSYLGTYAADRQQKLDVLFLEPARRRPDFEFVLAGSLYPREWHWPSNVQRFEHVPPTEHAALYSSGRATLNITRQEMADSGFCPSGRFFEAAACSAPILTDWWEGLDAFFDPGQELCVVRTAEDVLAYLDTDDTELRAKAERARNRTLAEHTGERRAEQLLAYCEEAYRGQHSATEVMA
jgi:spore maturation protein CgeB